MDALHFLESYRELEFDIAGSLCVMRQFKMIVIPVFLFGNSETKMPLQSFGLPELVPRSFSAGANEELHFHLLEFAHAEYELPRHNFISECLSNLRNAEGNLHPSCFLHIEKVHEYALRRFRPQIDNIIFFLTRCATELGGEHQIELAYLRPVGCAADRAFDAMIG